MKKKGMMLASETVKIVIALIAITFLVYLLVAVYFAKTKEVKKGQAEALVKLSSESLEVVINRVQQGGNAEEFSIPNPGGWYLFSFTGEKKPDSCERKNCLCVCDNVVNWFGFDRQTGECSEDGVCVIVSNLQVAKDLEMEISKKELNQILISKSGDKLVVTEK